MMQRVKVDAGLERQFLIAMIMSKPFLGSIVRSLDTSLFDIQYVKQIADWCIQHFKTYGDVPGRGIEALYHAWVQNSKPKEDDAQAIGDFLGGMSEEYD